LQIWYDTALFVNRYGVNGLAENAMTFVNMFLLYIMGVCTLNDWGTHYTPYILAWAGILLSLALQYGLKLPAAPPERKRHIRQHIALHLAQAALALLTIPIYSLTGWAFGPWAMVLGYAGALFLERAPMHFPHLTERVMLYVVFTFGEMIVTVSAYFSDGFSFDTLYFALMSFLTVAGLFFSYGFLYDNLLDRNRETDGTGYMLLHIFLILSLNNITNALEFMREPTMAAVPKTLFLVLSLLLYFFCLALTERWSTRSIPNPVGFHLSLGAAFALYVLLMVAALESRHAAVGLTVMFIYFQLYQLYTAPFKTERRPLS
ncbi:MAG: low temperature requirement protein A, partial [bacterium]